MRLILNFTGPDVGNQNSKKMIDKLFCRSRMIDKQICQSKSSQNDRQKKVKKGLH